MSSVLLIDESGTLPDINDHYIVLAAVYIPDRIEAERFIQKFRPKTQKRERMREIKFYHLGNRSKERFFASMQSLDCLINILIVDKNSRVIVDTPSNMAVLSAALLSPVLSTYDIDQIIFDRHFNRPVDFIRFDRALTNSIDITSEIIHHDSQAVPILSIADMVAGAALAKTRGNMDYYNSLKSKIIREQTFSWTHVRKQFLPKKIA